MKRSPAILVVMALAVGALAAWAQDRFAGVEVVSTHVAGGVHMLVGSGGNIGVSAGEDGLLMVDDQFAPLAEKIRKALRSLGKGELRFVVNTHFHGDHTGGNRIFGREAPIVAHRNVRTRLEKGRRGGPQPKEALPVVTYRDGLSLHFNGEEIEVLHLATGHTDGDSVVYFKGSKVVHMGDHFFVGRFPFIDLDSGGDVKGFIRNVEKVMKGLGAGVKIIPGHGPLATLEDLKAFHGMLVETSGIVRRSIDAGKSLEEVKSAGLPAKWETWGSGFINEGRWLETLYRGLKG